MSAVLAVAMLAMSGSAWATWQCSNGGPCRFGCPGTAPVRVAATHVGPQVAGVHSCCAVLAQTPTGTRAHVRAMVCVLRLLTAPDARPQQEVQSSVSVAADLPDSPHVIHPVLCSRPALRLRSKPPRHGPLRLLPQRAPPSLTSPAG